MAVVTDLDKERRTRKRRKTVKNLLLLLLFAVVVYGAALVSTKWGDVGLRAAWSEIVAEIQAGEGFPVTLEAAGVKDLISMNGAVLALFDSDFVTYNETGRELARLTHGTANTAYQSAGDMVFFFDRGETRAGLFSRAAQLQSHVSDYPILGGDVAPNGTYALATGSDLHLAQVSVWNIDRENIYTWFSEDKPVLCVALKNSGDEMIVGTVSVSGGFYSSAIIRFSFRADEEMGRIELNDTLLLDANYLDGDKLWALTDKGFILFDQNFKELASFSTSNRIIKRFYHDEASGSTVLLAEALSGQGQNEVLVLDSKLNQTGSWLVQSEVLDVVTQQDLVFTIEKNQFSVYDLTGQFLQRQTASGMEKLCVWNDNLYYSAAGTLYQTPMPGRGTEEKEG